MRALFLTWDGPQQSYLESLFLPIFSGLSRRGTEVAVLQLTWASQQQLEPVRAAAERAGIAYTSERISPLLRKAALPAVVAHGARMALGELRRRDMTTLLPRSLLPMSMALLAQHLRPSLSLVFDADGFMADERVDFSGWSQQSLQYRLLRRVEAAGVRRARAVVCRTEAAREILVERAGGNPSELRAKIFVAPNGKDPEVFQPRSAEANRATRAQHGIACEAPWLVYVGSVGPQYCLDLMLETFASVRRVRQDARLSCFTFQVELVRAAARQRDLPEAAVQARPLPPSDVPSVLSACDLGLAFRLEAFSQRGVSPIKVAEYLLSGAPVASSRAGDLATQLADCAATLLVDPTAPDSAERVARWFVEHVLSERETRRKEARERGLKWFTLERCVDTFAQALSHVPSGAAP